MLNIDDDGDLIVRRRGQNHDQSDHVLSEMHLEAKRDAENGLHITEIQIEEEPPIAIRHSLETPLSQVGLQLWRGAAVLADYLLATKAHFTGRTVLELGAGTGLPSIVLARIGSKRVFATDVGVATLQNCASNIAANCGGDALTTVRALDWQEPNHELIYQEYAEGPGCSSAGKVEGPSPFSWTPSDVAELRALDFILAADCIYDDVATEAFMRTSLNLMLCSGAPSRAKRPLLLVALEKRECFTMREMDVVVPAYDFWRRLFFAEGSAQPLSVEEQERLVQIGGMVLAGRQVDVGAVPHRVLSYARSGNLELWELWAENASQVLQQPP